MKTVLVTGSGGQLGKCIADLVVKNGNIHYIFANQARLDITDLDKVNDFFNKNNINWCVNCAAYTHVDLAESEKQKAFKINEKGVENLATVCKASNTKLIHISTDFVFDGSKKFLYLEKDKTNPISVYGQSKLKGEEKLQEILDKYFIIRTSWLYSEHQNNFLKTMLRLSETKKEISVVDDQIGTPTYAGDLARVIIDIIEKDSNSYGIYHYCNDGQTSWYGFAKEIFSLSSISIKINPIPSSDYKTAAKRPYYSVLDTNKIKKVLGLEIPNWELSLKAALKKLHE